MGTTNSDVSQQRVLVRPLNNAVQHRPARFVSFSGHTDFLSEDVTSLCLVSVPGTRYGIGGI